ncbi:MAG: AhpC/TSA family protein [Bacteroidetes bacterium]|nr:AhpC/TSA family protein [Bacteroidota bacterium]
MKKIGTTCLLLAAINVFSQGKSFVINGTIKKVNDNAYVYLSHIYNEQTQIDSALVKNEKFTFKGKTPEPNMYWITLHKNETPQLIFFADNAPITIAADADSMAHAKINGGTTQNDYKHWLAMQAKYAEMRNGLITQYNGHMRSNNQEGAKKVVDTAGIAERAYEKGILKFIKEHPQSNVSAYAIYSVNFDWPKMDEYEEMYNVLSPQVKAGKFGKLAHDKIEGMKMKDATVGVTAANFSQPDVNGKMVSLNSYKGKVVLVDFWASWCGPCRAENPNVVAAYQKYHPKGFEILGVSLDQNKDKWLQAISNDNLTWTHISDLKGWGNEAAKKYGVTSIPFNVLIDKEGKIIAKGLRGKALDDELAKIFGE